MIIRVQLCPLGCGEEAITSLAFMLLEVPDPVWKTSSGNSPSCRLAATSLAAFAIASP